MFLASCFKKRKNFPENSSAMNFAVTGTQGGTDIVFVGNFCRLIYN